MSLLKIFRIAYNSLLRERLPRVPTVSFNDVTTKKRRLLDLTTEFADDERTEAEALQEIIKPGDQVLIIGGGFGVTAVVASRNAGPEGQVTVYEAVPEYVDLTRWAIENNYTPAPVEVVTAVVADVTDDAVDQYGTPTSDVISPADLPDVDVWHVDAEGAEETILTAQIPPQRAVIEVHPDRFDESVVLNALPPHQRREKTVDAPQWIAVIGASK